MKIARLNRLLWLPTRAIDENRIKAETTIVTTTPHVGKPRKVILYETKTIDEEAYIGVPRAWGLAQDWLGHKVIDETDHKLTNWPDLTIDKFWKGQPESINAITKIFQDGGHGALLEAPCGSGKTLMSLAIASNLNVPALIMVHKEDLAWQWHKTVKNCFRGAKVGHVQRDKWTYRNKHVVTATAQTLYARQRNIPKDFFSNFGMIIFDEGHRYPAETFEKILRMSPCRYRLGISATWRRKDGLECIWHWHVGRVEWRTSSNRLVGEYTQIPWATQLYDKMFTTRGRLSHANWITAIADNDKYNAWLSSELVRGAKVGRRVLCVSDRISQLQNLHSRIIRKGAGVTVGLYVGSLNKKRLTNSELEAAKQCDIILASYGMMSEGTDIPALDTLFIGTPRVDVEQVVGRIQRHKDGKRGLLIVDPVFNTPYMRALATKRKKIYEKLEFKERVSNE